jgi:meso-butanediol dehydrogenase/(S,S)-butanediol dehydrogenase/diacetyl reductase
VTSPLVEPVAPRGLLADKVALITGAGQGVGQGIALALAAEGASVMAVGRTLSKVEDTAAEIVKRGGTARALAGDVKDEADIDLCVRATVEAFGTVDILVNNAQEVPLGPLLSMSRTELNDGWDSGPLAAFSFMKACHEHLKGGGVVINLATSASLRPDTQGYGVYGAVKEAMRTLTRAAACEWGPDGIRVLNLVPLAKSPGYLWWENDRPEEAAAFAATVPLGYVGDCEADIGRAAVFLCSPDARYVTGTTLMVDGGQAYLR